MDIIKGRKSVRTYDGRLLAEEDREKLEKVIAGAANPYGIEIGYRFLEPAKYGLKSPVLSGETLYLAAKVKKEPHFEEALGYSLEAVVIGAWKLGIGTVWIGGTMNRDAFEAAMDLAPDEVMPCVTPVGYPAAKRALREVMMRKGVKADWRLKVADFASEGSAGSPLTKESLDVFGEALEMVRWAPSAVNKQPWRVIVQGQKVHFYEKPDKGYVSEKTGDLQRIDVGIGMYHFVYGLESRGLKPVLLTEDPGIEVPSDWQYVATFDVEDEQIRRILYYEGLLNKAQDLLARDELTEAQAAKLREAAGELDIYLSSGEWRSDFEDDEAGLLPKDLPRGVLSEDGIYNVLEASAARLG